MKKEKNSVEKMVEIAKIVWNVLGWFSNSRKLFHSKSAVKMIFVDAGEIKCTAI